MSFKLLKKQFIESVIPYVVYDSKQNFGLDSDAHWGNTGPTL